MISIAIIGATGFVGAPLAAEASRRGHNVTGVSTSLPESTVEGVRYVLGDAGDTAVLADAMKGADVVVSSLSPRRVGGVRFGEVMEKVALATTAAGARLVVVGGAGAMRQGEGGSRIADDVPAPLADLIPSTVLAGEVRPVAAVVDWLEESAPPSLDWLYISPPFDFRPPSETPPAGRYRFEAPMARFDSALSVDDFAIAVLDEITAREHSGHIAVRGTATSSVLSAVGQ